MQVNGHGHGHGAILTASSRSISNRSVPNAHFSRSCRTGDCGHSGHALSARSVGLRGEEILSRKSSRWCTASRLSALAQQIARPPPEAAFADRVEDPYRPRSSAVSRSRLLAFAISTIAARASRLKKRAAVMGAISALWTV